MINDKFFVLARKRNDRTLKSITCLICFKAVAICEQMKKKKIYDPKRKMKLQKTRVKQSNRDYSAWLL